MLEIVTIKTLELKTGKTNKKKQSQDILITISLSKTLGLAELVGCRYRHYLG